MGEIDSIRPARPRKLSDAQLVTNWSFVVDGYTRTQRRLMRDVEDRGLPAPWFDVLLRLSRAPGRGLPMSRLASEVGMTTGGLTKLVDRMERAGLTERRGDDQDRRVVHTVLSARGAEVAATAVSRHATLLREVLLGALTEDDLRGLGAVMRRLRDQQSID